MENKRKLPTMKDFEKMIEVLNKNIPDDTREQLIMDLETGKTYTFDEFVKLRGFYKNGK